MVGNIFLGPPINWEWGLDAEKSAAPQERDAYVATDTEKVYFCYAAGTWTEFGVAAAAGEGHIILAGPDYNTIGQGTWVIAGSSSSWIGYIYNSSNVDKDNLIFKAYLDAGTYTLCLIYNKGVNNGILDIDIDAAEVASFDTYAAAAAANQRVTQTAIVVAAAGLKTITARVDGQNASSGGYRVFIQAIVLWRTA